LESINLKKIDVLCLDDGGNVKKTYDAFIKNPGSKYRFVNGNIQDYLRKMEGKMNDLDAHEDYIKNTPLSILG